MTLIQAASGSAERSDAFWAGALSRAHGRHLDTVRDTELPFQVGVEIDLEQLRERLGPVLPTGTDAAAAIAVLVSALTLRWSAQDETTVGLLCRGPFGDWCLPVTVALPETETLADLAAELFGAWADVAHHATEPPYQLLQRFDSDRDLRADPVYAVAVVDDEPTDDLLPGPSLVVSVGANGVVLQARGLSSETVDCFAAQLQVLALTATAESRVSELSLIDAAAAERVRNWGAGPARPVEPWRVPQRVHELAELHGDRPAVIDSRRTVSYHELDRAVRGLAASLQQQGVGVGARVGVCVDRSVDMVTALLAVMATGAAYVPIDPDYPRDRVELMLSDSGAAAVVTSRTRAAAISGSAPIVFVEYGGDADAFLPCLAPADSAAYVIYTSGSTGRPKGVVIPLVALANFLDSVATEPGLAPGERLLAVTTVSFDIAALELFLPLAVGATLIVADSHQARDPRALAQLLDTHDVDVMQATPATWRMLVDDGWKGSPRLRALCGGEALPPDLATALTARVVALWNMYGPTETTIWSALHPVTAGESPSLGHAFPNTDLYVVDRQLRLVPPGIPGELLIGGIGLALGYHDRAELTNEKFVTSPPCAPGERVYRTGDLVRWSPTGELVFLGRLDHQVKVNGHRIELGEVEEALRRAGQVRDAVVVAEPTASGGKRLIGYVAADQAIDLAGVRAELARTLPRYMLPATLVVLDALPRTPNGKVDRKALPTSTPRQTPAAQPRTALESRLLEVWREVLGDASIGVDDDFFALGVESLTAARLFARIERELDLDLPLAPVFEAPTVAKLAELIDRVTAGEVEAFRSLVKIQPNGAAAPFFAVHGGAGTVLFYAELARRLGPDQPFYGLQAIGLYGRDAPQRSVSSMAESYIEEIRRVQPRGPYRLGGYCYGALVAFEMAAQLRAAGDDVALVAMFNGPAPSYLRRYKAVFDDEGPVFDEGGELIRQGPLPASLPARVRRKVAQAESTREVMRSVARAVGHRIARRTAARRDTVRLSWSTRMHRPLPPTMREAHWFQMLAAQAQAAYEPSVTDVPIVVFRAEGLYYSDDLGWRDYTSGAVRCVEVQGSGQHIPRMSMHEPYVMQIADALTDVMNCAGSQ